MTAALISIVGLLVTLILAAFGAVFAYGKNIAALTQLANTVTELRTTVSNTLHRLGRLETREEVEREMEQRDQMSGRVQR